MECSRQIIQADQIEKLVHIPASLRHKLVEIIIIPAAVDEVRRIKFDPTRFEGIFEMSLLEVNKEVDQLRNQWERLNEDV